MSDIGASAGSDPDYGLPNWVPRLREQSPDVGKLASALSAAQAEIGNAAADSSNPHFNSKYADLASIRAAAAPIYKHGLSVVQQVISQGPDQIGLRTVLLHSSGEWLASKAFLKPERPGPQAAGSAITYLRRYMLAALLGIAQEDDDANGAEPQPRGRRAPRPQAPPAAAREPGEDDGEEDPVVRVRSLSLKHAPDGLGWHPEHATSWLKKYFGKERPAQLTQAQARDAAMLLQLRLRTPELYPARLEMLHAEGRTISGEYER